MNLGEQISSELREEREKVRVQEWKTDVPTIGQLYRRGGKPRSVVVKYFNGLGRRFQPTGWNHQRHWLKRAWTVQETVGLDDVVVGGLPPGMQCPWKLEVRLHDL